MGMSSHLGPLRLGTIKEGSDSDMGLVSSYQYTTLPAPAQSISNIWLPAGAMIIDIIVDVSPLFDGTTPTLNVGTAASPTLYASGVALTAAARVRPTFTAAQLIAIQNVGATNVRVQVQNTAANSTVGVVRVTIEYVMRQSTGSVAPIV